MTVPENSRSREHYGNGVTTVFNGPMAYVKEHVKAMLYPDGPGSVQEVPPSQYDVENFGRPSGTRVVMHQPPAAGARLVLVRVLPYSQDVDITNQGAFLPESLERGFDLLGMQVQQVAANLQVFLDTDPTALAVESAEAAAVSEWNANQSRIQAAIAAASADADAVSAAGSAIEAAQTVSDLRDDVDAIRDGQGAGQLVYQTWAELEAVSGAAGNGAQVIDDTGTHTDPVTAATVPNEGAYVWDESAEAWRWVRPDGLALKADKSDVDAIAAGQFDSFRVVQLPPETGYAFALVDDTNGRSPLLVSLDGTVQAAKMEIAGSAFDRLPAETGYAFALLDAHRRIGLALTSDGVVEAPKAVVGGGRIVTLPAETGYAFAITDDYGRIALAVTLSGEVVGSFNGGGGTASPYITPTKNIWCIGDSLTAGAGGQTTWRQVIEANNPTRVVTNGGIGGQTSTQIAGRVGSYVSRVSVTGDQIPASGGVTLTSLTIKVLSTPANDSGGTTSISGWLGGVYGTLSCVHATTGDADDVYTFTRSAAGTAVYLAPGSAFVPDPIGHDFDVLVVFLGRNNLAEPDIIKRDIARCVALQKTVEKRFLVITPPNGGTLTPGNSTNEGTGSQTLANIKAIEEWAVQEYGDRVLLSRPFSWQFNNGSADDLDDVAKETVPRSLRIDGVHWTTAFHAHVAAWVQNELNRRNW